MSKWSVGESCEFVTNDGRKFGYIDEVVPAGKLPFTFSPDRFAPVRSRVSYVVSTQIGQRFWLRDVDLYPVSK